MAVLESDSLKARDCGAAGPALRKMYGCDEPLPESRNYLGYAFNRCPCFYVQDQAWLHEVFAVYNWLKKGFLPYPGTWLDQPNVIIELCEWIDMLLDKRQDMEIEKHKAKRPKVKR